MRSKIVKVMFFFLLLIPILVKAESQDISEVPHYVNALGTKIRITDCEKIIAVYDEDYMEMMTEEDYERFRNKKIDLNNLVQSKAYIKTTINHITDEVSHTQVSEAEYNNYSPENDSIEVYLETEYKHLTLTGSAYGDGYGDVTLGVVWKAIPVRRSFDILAVRYVGIESINGTQTGKQVYKINGELGYVDYGWNGTNINRKDNGFGISMNLINSTDVDYFRMYIDSEIKFTGQGPTIYGTYQHAIKNVTLAASKNYIFTSGGLGGVIDYQSSFQEKYDDMQGLAIYFY